MKVSLRRLTLIIGARLFLALSGLLSGEFSSNRLWLSDSTNRELTSRDSLLLSEDKRRVNSLAVLRLLPRNTISWIVGRLAQLELPRFANRWLIRQFAGFYNIDLEESEKDYSEYRSLAEFFVRKLKQGSRPISDAEIVCPADGELTLTGLISNQEFYQVKGVSYPLEKLVGERKLAESFEAGSFATIYLAPHNYHRVHSPVDGTITRILHIPGTLWPVNKQSVLTIPELFAINERVIFEIESPVGRVAVIMVGATNVGSIQLKHHSLRTNANIRWGSYNQTSLPAVIYDVSQPVEKGEEIGAFHFGSTVVVLFGRTAAQWLKAAVGKVRVGESWVSLDT